MCVHCKCKCQHKFISKLFCWDLSHSALLQIKNDQWWCMCACARTNKHAWGPVVQRGGEVAPSDFYCYSSFYSSQMATQSPVHHTLPPLFSLSPSYSRSLPSLSTFPSFPFFPPLFHLSFCPLVTLNAVFLLLFRFTSPVFHNPFHYCSLSFLCSWLYAIICR